MRKWLAMLRPKPWMTRRLMMTGVMAGVATGAFCWGRHGAVPQVEAQQRNTPTYTAGVTNTPGATTADYSRRAVGYIYDNIPITREELGEYLIARFGKQRSEFLINRKIVDMECKTKGVIITEAQIDAQVIEDIRSFGSNWTLQKFESDVLKRYQKTLFEWREDVVRPKLELQELVRPLVSVTAQDIQSEFEARYGPKVHCRMIVMTKNDSQRDKVWQRAAQSEAGFKQEAHGASQAVQELRPKDGDVPPIHTHFPEPAIEQAAFGLKDGQTSGLIQCKDGSWVILHRENAVPPDMTKTIDSERPKLAMELRDRNLQLQIPEYFRQLIARARPHNLLNPRPNQTAVSAPGPVPSVPRAN